MRILVITLLLAITSVSFGQKVKYDEFYLDLYNKDSLKVVILSTAKYLKSIDNRFSNDTLYINAKLSILKKEEISPIIKLKPEINYVNFNKDIYYIEPNNTFTTIAYKLVKQPLVNDEKNKKDSLKKK